MKAFVMQAQLLAGSGQTFEIYIHTNAEIEKLLMEVFSLPGIFFFLLDSAIRSSS